MLSRSIITIAAAFAFVQSAGAATIDGDAPITAVTVYPNRAAITRTIDLELPAGTSAVALADLPADLIADSIRVEGRGNEGLRLGAVDARRVFATEVVRERERQLRSEIQALGDRRKVLSDRKAALNIQLEIIRNIGREIPETANEEFVRGPLRPQTWREAWLTIGEAASAVLTEIHEGEIEQREIDNAIAAKERQLQQLATGERATTALTINLEAATAGPAQLTLSYHVPGAGWRPLYEARLDTETGRVTLVQLAEVHQRTGEAWREAALTLSTARPGIGADAPTIGTWFVDVQRPATGEGRRRSEAELFDELVERAPREMDEPEAPANKQQHKIAQEEAAPIVSEFAAEYRVPGRVTLPADNSKRLLRLAAREYPLDLSVRAIPKRTTNAFLIGTLTYDGDLPLLAGGVSIYRDNAFVGSGAFAMIRPGEKTDLSFGVDDRVRVTYRLAAQERSRQGLINKDRQVQRRYIVEVQNGHDRAIEIMVLDQLPVPVDERIDVRLAGDATAPTDPDWHDHKGVLGWRHTYKPGEERQIVFAYELTYPEELILSGF